MLLAQAEQAIQLVDHAASMNDRWIMLALLVIILGSTFYIIRYLLTAQSTQQESHAKAMSELQTTHQNFVTSLFRESVQMTAQATVTISENTIALRDVKDVIEEIRKGR